MITVVGAQERGPGHPQLLPYRLALAPKDCLCMVASANGYPTPIQISRNYLQDKGYFQTFPRNAICSQVWEALNCNQSFIGFNSCPVMRVCGDFLPILWAAMGATSLHPFGRCWLGGVTCTEFTATHPHRDSCGQQTLSPSLPFVTHFASIAPCKPYTTEVLAKYLFGFYQITHRQVMSWRGYVWWWWGKQCVFTPVITFSESPPFPHPVWLVRKN